MLSFITENDTTVGCSALREKKNDTVEVKRVRASDFRKKRNHLHRYLKLEIGLQDSVLAVLRTGRNSSGNDFLVPKKLDYTIIQLSI